MDEQQKQLIDRINQAQNVLVAVSANPSVDQLSAAIGLTLVLNKIGKHGTAVFSGEVPSTLEFLKPDETLEKNTDSLRDFIIALDKNKADKLRYKVEDDVVRIFITPYKTSITDKDLQFSQGDFNVDVVVCLGVTEQQDLDSAITAHGRILHDATVASLSTQGQGSLGSINWVQPTASSLSEMVVGLADGLDKKAMDGQIATALLTGIVASTERFSNDKTTPKTMSASAELMSAGANQQLIATQLESPAPADDSNQPAAAEPSDSPEASESAQPEASDDRPESNSEGDDAKSEPGMLEIDHPEEPADDADAADDAEDTSNQIHVDDDGTFMRLDELNEASQATEGADKPAEPAAAPTGRQRISEPPQLDGGDLTANTQPEALDPPTEELSLPSLNAQPLLSHNGSVLSAPQPAPAGWQPPADTPAITPDETLTQIEQSVDSPHLDTAPAQPAGGVDSARDAVEAALRQAGPQSDPLKPIEALNAQAFGPELQTEAANESPAVSGPTAFTPPLPVPDPVLNTGFSEPTPGNSPADETLDMPLPTNGFGAAGPVQPFPNTPQSPPSAFPGAAPQNDGQDNGTTPPPPVPPPMLPPLQ